MKTQELITVEQFPVITERFRLAGEEVARRVAAADALICTEDSKQAVKKERAELNKERDALDKHFKEIESQVLSPWNQVKEAYKQHIFIPYLDGDKRLKAKIDAIEDEQKLQKLNEVKAYFEEYAVSRHLDGYYINWDRTGINVTLSASIKSLKSQAKEYVDLRCKHLESISKRENAAEILVEYQQSLNIMDAIEAVERRHKALAEQAARQAEIEAQKAADAEAVRRVEAAIPAPLEPPVIKAAEDDPMKTLSFKVTAPLSMLKELKKFLNDGGYQYE